MATTAEADDTSISLSFKGLWTRMRGRSLRSLEGYYFDPKHGGCFRTIRKTSDNHFLILGVYGNDEARAAGDFWSATIVTGAESNGRIPMTVSFGGKEKEAAGKVLTAEFVLESKTILWQDKNRWVPCYCNRKQFVWTGIGASVAGSSYIGCNPRF